MHEKERAFKTWLVDRVAQLAEVNSSKIDIHEPFAVYGFDSVQAVGMIAEIEDQFLIRVSPTVVWDYPTISTLAKYLATQEPIK